jgi:hypothetical protein
MSETNTHRDTNVESTYQKGAGMEVTLHFNTFASSSHLNRRNERTKAHNQVRGASAGDTKTKKRERMKQNENENRTSV